MRPASFCNPSRGPTSTILTCLGINVRDMFTGLVSVFNVIVHDCVNLLTSKHLGAKNRNETGYWRDINLSNNSSLKIYVSGSSCANIYIDSIESAFLQRFSASSSSFFKALISSICCSKAAFLSLILSIKANNCWSLLLADESYMSKI